jgi:serine/threonine protein phosphatase PrpC
MRWSYDLASRLGNRADQQDRVAVLDCPDQICSLAVLADGLGGHSDGAIAAQEIINTARQAFLNNSIGDSREFLTGICNESHRRIKKLRTNGADNPASTCVLLLLTDTEAHWAHVGDSRLYHFNGNKLLFRTRDHSLAEFERMKRGIDYNYEEHDCDNNLLYMCLGGQNEINPEYGATCVGESDWFLLCTDGVWGGLQPWEMVTVYDQREDINANAKQLAEIAVRRTNPNADNASVIVAFPRESRSSRYSINLGSLLGSLLGRAAA